MITNRIAPNTVSSDRLLPVLITYILAQIGSRATMMTQSSQGRIQKVAELRALT